MRLSPIIFLILLSTVIFSFSIDDYYTKATVFKNGDLQVYEKITFTLEKVYNEGFRSIRNEDYENIDNIHVDNVSVNGNLVPFTTDLNGRNAEIIWKKTYMGKNVVELNYTLKNRVQLYDDFAKVCFEHYGSNWPVSAANFKSITQLPEETRGKDMHFEVYSTKQGNAYIEDLSVVIEMKNVPSGNHIGGCYLFDKNATTTTRTVSGLTYEILKNERKINDSKTILSPNNKNKNTSPFCCLPIFIITIIAAAYAYKKDKEKHLLPENIMPPEKEEPAVVSLVAINSYSEKNILAATILDLINRGIVDIIELEKKGESGAEIKRERTILILKKNNATLKPHEKAVVDMIFSNSKEVDLDQMAKDYDKIKTKAEAANLPITINFKKFQVEIDNLLKTRKLFDKRDTGNIKTTILFLLVFFSIPFGGFLVLSSISSTLNSENSLNAILFLVIDLGIIGFAAYAIKKLFEPGPFKGFEDKFNKWDAFVRAVKASRLKEYPPASAVIWGEILVYATALGLADKVNVHLSELNSLVTQRMEKLQMINRSSYMYYGSALALNNLAKYGNRSGPNSSGRGGFGGGSSGGWSSGGGGGFSGGSSGGGGFR
ncbi:MAG: DUF2207 domain-containing protein [Candidatus Micrarchaeota archaeon]|nr:DUF2207 domain-containing protein [Candidatus Micrarchaeota archaeon]